MVVTWSNAVDKRYEHTRPQNRYPEDMELRHKWGYINSNLGRAIRIPEFNQIIKNDIYNKKGIVKAGVKSWKQQSTNEMTLRRNNNKYKHYNYAILNYRNDCPGRYIIMNITTCAQLSAWINIIGEGDEVTLDNDKVCSLCGKTDSTKHVYDTCDKLPFHEKLLGKSIDTELKPFIRKIAIINYKLLE